MGLLRQDPTLSCGYDKHRTMVGKLSTADLKAADSLHATSSVSSLPATQQSRSRRQIPWQWFRQNVSQRRSGAGRHKTWGKEEIMKERIMWRIE
jgi:hypothetical protein